ncbi:MAG TPA: hypothetical protein VG737_17500, partial [Cyclobacteriaceae bacterium]|nr:hypothetical protein [Cyclobacteriaceae bacterium]
MNNHMYLTLILFFVSTLITAHATNLEVRQIELVLSRAQGGHPRDLYVDVSVSWQNAWFNKKNYDAAWIFFKYIRNNGGYSHAKIRSEGHSFL